MRWLLRRHVSAGLCWLMELAGRSRAAYGLFSHDGSLVFHLSIVAAYIQHTPFFLSLFKDETLARASISE